MTVLYYGICFFEYGSEIWDTYVNAETVHLNFVKKNLCC